MCNRTDEMCRILLIIILHYISAKESNEAIEHECADSRFVQVLSQERREACQKTVRERLTVNSVDDFGDCQVELL